MKKLTLTLFILLGLGFGAMAQNGLFDLGPSAGGNDFNGDRETGTGLLSLPSSHGETGDAAAPLGTGTAILLGFGAVYMITKKRKK